MDIRLIAGISALAVVIVMWLYYILRDKKFFSSLGKNSQSTFRSLSANTQQQQQQQLQFGSMSNTNHKRLHTFGSKSNTNNLNERAKAERNAQTVIAMTEQTNSKNREQKLPHFCKAPNDSDMIKRY